MFSRLLCVLGVLFAFQAHAQTVELPKEGDALACIQLADAKSVIDTYNAQGDMGSTQLMMQLLKEQRCFGTDFAGPSISIEYQVSIPKEKPLHEVPYTGYVLKIEYGGRIWFVPKLVAVQEVAEL